MGETTKRLTGREALLLALFVGLGVCWLGWYGAQLPAGWDEDAAGRAATAVNWSNGEATPSFTQGPVHFYLLRLAMALGVPDAQLRFADLSMAGLFIIFFVLLNRRLFGSAVAFGSAAALSAHPFFAKLAGDTSGFMPFFAFLWMGFWAVEPILSDQQVRSKIGRLLFGGLMFGATVFTRFEGLFFFCFLAGWLILQRNWKSAAYLIAGFGLISLMIFSLTYFTLSGLLQGSLHFTVHPEAVPQPQLFTFLVFLCGAIGIVPLSLAIVGALPALKNAMLRPWIVMSLLYGAMVIGYYLAGRFDYHWSRYYLLLLPLLLPLFGATIARRLKWERPLWTGAAVLFSFLICTAFYAGSAWQELIILQKTWWK